ncbi:hypothetical protein KFE25_013774 [Diacronema lutheri]|uniref:Uncharacterized protein n=2 Tax=Diacronema lutheri TaxID=2081491 RepID=A0A8J5XTL4_DIALT|nr:hypothetical protein KFE25_013774 [Diacronema lutheri]
MAVSTRVRDFWRTVSGDAIPLDIDGRAFPPFVAPQVGQRVAALPPLGGATQPLWNAPLTKQGAVNAAHASAHVTRAELPALAGLSVDDFRRTPVGRIPLVVSHGTIRRARGATDHERRLAAAHERVWLAHARHSHAQTNASHARLHAKRTALEAVSTGALGDAGALRTRPPPGGEHVGLMRSAERRWMTDNERRTSAVDATLALPIAVVSVSASGEHTFTGMGGASRARRPLAASAHAPPADAEGGVGLQHFTQIGAMRKLSVSVNT